MGNQCRSSLISQIKQLKQQLNLYNQGSNSKSSQIKQLKQQLNLYNLGSSSKKSRIKQLKHQLNLNNQCSSSKSSKIKQLKYQLNLHNQCSRSKNIQIIICKTSTAVARLTYWNVKWVTIIKLREKFYSFKFLRFSTIVAVVIFKAKRRAI